MSASISDIPKKRGRPSTGGRRPGMFVRMGADELATVDRWIDKQPAPKPSRPEAIRRLVKKALSI